MKVDWKGNDVVFKGYATGDGKTPTMKVKGAKLLSWSEVCKNDSFGAILNDDYVDISFDSDELSQKFWDMSEKNNWNCLILENPKNGHIHSYWKDTKKRVGKGGKDKKLAVGLIADIHSGSTYIPLRVDGVDRFPPSFEPDSIDEVPEELIPVNTKIDLLSLSEGDGRNDELFKYILVLQSQLALDKDSIRRILENTNHFIFQDALSKSELDVILRDDAFNAPVFFEGKTFLFDRFAQYLKNEYHIIKINSQLHIYNNGIYDYASNTIEAKMIEKIPTLTAQRRTEVMKYLELICEEKEQAEANYIAFKNGIYDIATDTMIPYTPDIILTNRINYNYNPNAESDLADTTLNKISCNDTEVRALLEECIGYCFYRRNELGKAFILTGDKANGKSTFLDLIKTMLGDNNTSALDLRELGDRFSTAMMFGKLANIGDDIGDEFMQGSAVSIFKKVVTGNRVKAEQKGKNPFEFNPYVKLLFSANDMPRMRDKTGAVLRRLVMIPFNATFTKDDPDYDPFIKYKLIKEDSIEYLIKVGIEGLKRVLINNSFTESSKVKTAITEYEEENNPIIAFINEVGKDAIINQPTTDVYLRYSVFCSQYQLQVLSKIVFSKQINKRLNTITMSKRINGAIVRIFSEG